MITLESKQEKIVDFQQASLEFTAAVSEPISALDTIPSGWAFSVVFALLIGLYLWNRGTPVWSHPQFAEQAPIVRDGPSLQEKGLWICVDEYHRNQCLSLLAERLAHRFPILVVSPPSQLLPPLLGSIEVVSPGQAKKHILNLSQRLKLNRTQGVVLSMVEIPQQLIDHRDVFCVILQTDYPKSWDGVVYGADLKDDWIWTNQSM